MRCGNALCGHSHSRSPPRQRASALLPGTHSSRQTSQRTSTDIGAVDPGFASAAASSNRQDDLTA
jgi:hypothetical protein